MVEMHDVTAQEPKLLVHLKATRNTVPVPRHWCFKRKYLQGKRGIEKPPFELPDFIKKTGIQEMREALQEKVGSVRRAHEIISRRCRGSSDIAPMTDWFFPPLAGRRQNHENQNEGEGSAQDGKDRHRLPEAARRLLQVADQTKAHHSRRPLLRGARSLFWLAPSHSSRGRFFGCFFLNQVCVFLCLQGKEFETRLKEKKPGDLSDELRIALGMPVGPVRTSHCSLLAMSLWSFV